MKALEIYKRPFRADGTFIFSSNNVMALMASDCHNSPEKLMERTCEILNGDSPSNGNPNLSYSNGEVFNGAQLLLVVRGFGHLTGRGGLNLPIEEALRIQDEFGEWVCGRLRNDKE